MGVLVILTMGVLVILVKKKRPLGGRFIKTM